MTQLDHDPSPQRLVYHSAVSQNLTTTRQEISLKSSSIQSHLKTEKRKREREIARLTEITIK